MKAHLARVSLALLSTVFLLGCQEQGSGPVGPDGPQFHGTACEKHHKKDEGCGGGGGGGGKDIPVGVTVDGGMNTGTEPPQLMQLAEDESSLRLAASAPSSTKEPYFELANSLTNTGPIGSCVQTGPGAPNNDWAATLFAELVQPLVAREVAVWIDKTALGGTSETHRIHHADNSEIGGIKIKVFAPTVTVSGSISGNFSATFSGGDIRVSGSPTGKVKDRVHLTCAIQDGDEITFTVVR